MKKEEGNKRVLMIAILFLIVAACIIIAMLYNKKENVQKQAADAQESAAAMESTAKTEAQSESVPLEGMDKFEAELKTFKDLEESQNIGNQYKEYEALVKKAEECINTNDVEHISALEKEMDALKETIAKNNITLASAKEKKAWWIDKFTRYSLNDTEESQYDACMKEYDAALNDFDATTCLTLDEKLTAFLGQVDERTAKAIGWYQNTIYNMDTSKLTAGQKQQMGEYKENAAKCMQHNDYKTAEEWYLKILDMVSPSK